MTLPKPSKTSRYKQGYFIPNNPEKYIGPANTPIVYRSGWEFRLMKWFDQNKNIKFWNSESIAVPYFWEVDQKMHKYYVDFLAKMILKDGSERVYAIEVKPKAQMEPPKTRNKKRLVEEMATYTKNQAKWKAAKEFFAQKGAIFIVINEKDMGIA